MIRHIILFKAKPELTKSLIDSEISAFMDIKNELPGIIAIGGGRCAFHEEHVKVKVSKFFDHAISIDFKNLDALEDFFNNPSTLTAKERIENITDGAYENIIGFDFMIT